MHVSVNHVTVLVVDDDVSILRILKQLLKEKGYNVVTAEDGIEALKVISDNEFDLVITDLMMPGVDGLEVLKNAKERNARTQVIMITGFATLDSAIDALKLGAFDYIRKPFKLAELDVTIRNAIDKIHLIKSNETLLNHLKAKHVKLKKTVETSVDEIEKDIVALEKSEKKVEELSTYGLAGNNVPFHLKEDENKKTASLDELERLTQLHQQGGLTKEEFILCKKKLLGAL